MIGHDHIVTHPISLPMKMLERFGDLSSGLWPSQLASPEALVKRRFPLLRELPVEMSLLFHSELLVASLPITIN